MKNGTAYINTLSGKVPAGIVVTDLPINVLTAMRDAIDDAIQQQAPGKKVYREGPYKDDYIAQIREALAAAHRAGYDVYIGDELTDEYADIYLEDSDDDEDEDEDWDNEDEYEDEDEDEYDPCEDCQRRYCSGCRFEDY